MIETKNYSGTINDHGEFTAEYDDDRFGIPSPIEQKRPRTLIGRWGALRLVAWG